MKKKKTKIETWQEFYAHFLYFINAKVFYENAVNLRESHICNVAFLDWRFCEEFIVIMCEREL